MNNKITLKIPDHTINPLLGVVCNKVDMDDDGQLSKASVHVKMIRNTLNSGGNGVGLAANQVCINSRIICVNLSDGSLDMINPEIVEMSGRMKYDEGCLSVCGGKKIIKIKRKSRVVVDYFNSLGEKKQIISIGLDAAILQHEIDHLNGITILDKQRGM